jgi:glycosyltransferase involved in cell wall biosynthesis
MQEIAVLYDVGDDWSTLTMSRRARQRVLAEDGLLTRTADAVVVVSKELRQPKLKVRPDVQLVPNGVDVECYLVVGDEQTPTHPLVKDWKRPVFGHTGTLHPDRTDVNLVLKLARRMPTATIALVGPNMLKREQTAMLEEQPNIVLTGSVRHDELPQIMHAMDVFIVPHLVNDVSGSQNPLKLWEYLAAGRPTVATNVAGFRDYPHLVHMAEEAEAFVREAVRLAETGDNLTEARRAEAAKHTWSRRGNQIEAVLDSLAPQARPEAGTADQFDHGVAAVHDVETPERGRSGENG